MSSIIDRSPEQVRGEVRAKSSLGRVRKPLLVCGIAASLLYGVMIWVIKYEGYSPISQTVSELSAWGVSTRTALDVARHAVRRAHDRLCDGGMGFG